MSTLSASRTKPPNRGGPYPGTVAANVLGLWRVGVVQGHQRGAVGGFAGVRRAVRFVCRRSGVRFVDLSACRRVVRFVYLSAYRRALRLVDLSACRRVVRFVYLSACRVAVRFVCRRADVRRGWCDASGVRVAQVALACRKWCCRCPGGGLWGRLVHRDQRRDRTGSFGVDIPGGALGDDSGGS